MAQQKHKVPKPTKCIEYFPRRNSLLFCGEFINLSCLYMETGISVQQLSYVFAGKRDPSWPTLQRMAAGLGMKLGEFTEALLDQTEIEKRYRLRGGRLAQEISNSNA